MTVDSVVLALPEACHERPAALVTASLRKSFGSGEQTVLALDSISMQVPRGQLTAVFGPDGGGKSTLLRILAAVKNALANFHGARRRWSCETSRSN